MNTISISNNKNSNNNKTNNRNNVANKNIRNNRNKINQSIQINTNNTDIINNTDNTDNIDKINNKINTVKPKRIYNKHKKIISGKILMKNDCFDINVAEILNPYIFNTLDISDDEIDLELDDEIDEIREENVMIEINPISLINQEVYCDDII